MESAPATNTTNANKVQSPHGATGIFLSPKNIGSVFVFKKGMHVADFGTGSGDFALEVARLIGPEGIVTGIDIRQVALEIMNEKMRIAGMENYRLIHANLETPNGSSLDDSSQDAVLLINILFQSSEKSAIILEAIRVLKKGGHILVIDWKKGAGGFGPPSKSRMAPDELKGLLTDAKLEVLKEIEAGSFHFGYVCMKKTE